MARLPIDRLGLPVCRLAARRRSEDPLQWLARERRELPSIQASSKRALLSVCTSSHLGFARTMIESFRRHHPATDCYVVVADWDGRDPAQLRLPDATPLAGRTLVGEGFGYLALKYSASDLCCALKPYGLEPLLAEPGYETVVYLDADILVFAPFDQLYEQLARHDFVVTPHVRAPLPQPERFWEEPTLGRIAEVGVFNAGMVGMRVGDEARRFVSTWRDLVSGPGAFIESLGGQREQNSFNWITCFASDVGVLRDPAYNVAYWNLHERSLRWQGLDGGAPTRWDVDGQPLVAYHFSGFSPSSPFTISSHDRRHSLFSMPSLARLFEFYRGELARNGIDDLGRRPYAFSAFPSGAPIDDRMREIFKIQEPVWRSALDPWTPAGEEYYAAALLSPAPHAGSLIPPLFDAIYEKRVDLQFEFPEAPREPQRLFQWMAVDGVKEYGYQQLFDRHRQVRITSHGARALLDIAAQEPAIVDGLERPLGADRTELIRRLRAGGHPALADQIDSTSTERLFVSTIAAVRGVLDERPDVQRAFPDPLCADAEPFASWLRADGVREHFLPAHAADVFLHKTGGNSLARIYSRFSRHWSLMTRWPLAFVGRGHRELAQALMPMLRQSPEFDFDDLCMFEWTMDSCPWVGVALTLELPYNGLRQPSPLTWRGQDELLAPVLGAEPRFASALTDYRARFPAPPSLLSSGASPASWPVAASDWLARPESRPPRPSTVPTTTRFERGVNLFGFHRSPVGLGTLTTGMGKVIRAAGIPCAANLLGYSAVDDDLAPADFVRRHVDSYDTNVFVTFPHQDVIPTRTVPDHQTRGRRNIAYLAWEQRDASHHWGETLADFDQLWALSEFAASALRTATGRPVLSVPAALETDALPAPADKLSLGLNPDVFHFLYVFDAGSSIERKNPEALLRAFGRAFSASDPVRLVLKITNAARPEHRERLRRMLRAAPDWLEPIFVLDDLGRTDLLRLVSAADSYVSLHRCEGFGYTCAEAMAYGKPVIATGYSGNLEFMDAGNSLLVGYSEATVENPDGPFQRGSLWAEPDIEQAAAAMRRVVDQPDWAREIGERARRSVTERLSVPVIARRVGQALYPDAHGRPPQTRTGLEPVETPLPAS